MPCCHIINEYVFYAVMGIYYKCRFDWIINMFYTVANMDSLTIYHLCLFSLNNTEDILSYLLIL